MSAAHFAKMSGVFVITRLVDKPEYVVMTGSGNTVFFPCLSRLARLLGLDHVLGLARFQRVNTVGDVLDAVPKVLQFVIDFLARQCAAWSFTAQILKI